jgi:type III pantothenate kinase
LADVLLTIDVGNTDTVLGLFDGTQLVEHWRIATDARRTADELALLVSGLLAMSERRAAVAGIACCSTVPSILHQVRDMGVKYFADVPLVIVEPGVRTGVPVLMDNPKEVGTDRIVNALAAYALYGGPAVVVDFGTSTNFDVVSAKGEFIGGALAPGIEISVDALAARAAQLLKVELLRPRSVIGKTTVEALQSGILYGFAGQVDRIAAEIVAELGGKATVIATGGLAPLVLEESRTIAVHEPWLTLIGLRLVFEKNT